MSIDGQIASAANNAWLTSEEVFGKGETLRAANARSPLKGNSATVQIEKTFTPLAHLSAQKDSKTLALPSRREVTIGKSLQNWVKRSPPQPASNPQPRSTLVHPKTSRRQLTQTPTPTRDRAQVAISSDRDSIQTRQKSTRSTPSDYIDTQATPIGYIKSPLTKFLEWLDTGIVWLEKQLATFWNLLTRRF